MDGKIATGTENLCRLCLKHCTVCSSLFENNAIEMLDKLTSIKIDNYDPYTTSVCSDCFTDLKNAYMVQQRIIESQRQLVELSEDTLCIKKEKVDDVCEGSENTLHTEGEVEAEVDVPEIIKSEIKMEVDKIEEYCDSENSNLIADTDYGHIEENDDIAQSTKVVEVPERSKRHYIREYDVFCEWRARKNVTGASEETVVAYFSELAENLKSATLWSKYSMLRSVMALRENVNIERFDKLKMFLKKKNVGYQPKRSKTLTGEELVKFFSTAPDDRFLLIKLVTVFGIAGACRSDELHNIQVTDVKDKGSYLHITLRDPKSDKQREFTITEDDAFANGLELYRKYMKLRPVYVKSSSLFLTYRMGRVTTQPFGIHSIGKISRTIAEFLNLEDPHLYTGHCIRRTSATLMQPLGGALRLRSVKKILRDRRDS